MQSRIRVVPINAIDQTFLSRLALCLEERFLSTIDVAAPLNVPSSAVNSQRGQMFLSSLTSKIARAGQAEPSASSEQADGLRLAITEFDLYKTGHRFLFGDGDRQTGIAVVSLHRLRAEFY